MKRFRLGFLVLALVFVLQSAVFAGDVQTSEFYGKTVLSDTIQPRGRYLQGGGCTITPYSNYVMVSGHTDSFNYVDQITVKVTVLQEVSRGYWRAIWSDSITEYNETHTAYPRTRVNVTPGYNYMVEAIHTVKHNGVTESNYSETGSAYVS